MTRFRNFPEVTSLEENEKFCEFLQKFLDIQCVLSCLIDRFNQNRARPVRRSATVIPNLSLGLSLSSRYLSPDRLDSFMRRMLVTRISRRVLAEHHLALTKSFSKQGEETNEPHVGIIFTGLNVKRSVDRCTTLLRGRAPQVEGAKLTEWPVVITDGHLDTQFPYIREQLECVAIPLVFDVCALFINVIGTSSLNC